MDQFKDDDRYDLIVNMLYATNMRQNHLIIKTKAIEYTTLFLLKYKPSKDHKTKSGIRKIFWKWSIKNKIIIISTIDNLNKEININL